MKYKVGMKVMLNGTEYEIIGTHKRSWLIEDADGKHYKCTSKMMDRIKHENETYGTGRRRKSKKSSTHYMERRVSYNKLWDKNARLPETEDEMFNWLERISMDLSPENLTCDGELSNSAVRTKYRELMAEWREVENMLGRKVSEGEVEDRMMAKWRS